MIYSISLLIVLISIICPGVPHLIYSMSDTPPLSSNADVQAPAGDIIAGSEPVSIKPLVMADTGQSFSSVDSAFAAQVLQGTSDTPGFLPEVILHISEDANIFPRNLRRTMCGRTPDLLR